MTDLVEKTTGSPRWLTLLVIGLSGLFYAYAVWNAVAHLISMAAQNGLTGAGWVTLLFGVVFPALVFVFALAIGRRRRVGELSLVLLAGLGLVAVFWLSLLGYSVLNMGQLVGTAT
jgi:F0F1-type ATP synthase membrane subunit c/vacuolar-type H+-ATPase subunit K